MNDTDNTPKKRSKKSKVTRTAISRGLITISNFYVGAVAQVPPDSVSRLCVGAAGAISERLNWTRNPIFRGW